MRPSFSMILSYICYMSKLLQVFDVYGDFERAPFFSYTYNAIPSELGFVADMDAKQSNLERVLEVMNLPDTDFELVRKNWRKEDKSEMDIKEYYPHELLYKGLNKSCLVWIFLAHGNIHLEFLYDVADEALEKWVIEKHQAIRKQFGQDGVPKFNVLTKIRDTFDTEDVKTSSVKVDIEGHYNDDFGIVDKTVQEGIKSDKSGLIMLHGSPGTGKTTYIKGLISKHHQRNFIFVQNEFITHLLEPDFISFLLRQKNAVLIIEDAEKVIISREQAQENSVVSTLLQLTDGLFSDYLNIKVICTFNSHMSKIDKALLRKGRMIAMYEFKPLSVEKTNRLLEKLGASPTHQAMTLADIFNHSKDNFSNTSDGKKIGFL